MMDYLSPENEEYTDEENSWMTYLKESHPEHFSVWSSLKYDFNKVPGPGLESKHISVRKLGMGGFCFIRKISIFRSMCKFQFQRETVDKKMEPLPGFKLFLGTYPWEVLGIFCNWWDWECEHAQLAFLW